jgi:hypothetical protein
VSAACVGLLGALSAPLDAAPEGPCGALSAEIAGGFSRAWPETGVNERFVLPRAQVQAALGQGPVGLRAGLAAVRSGGEGGYIGVAGEAIVPEVQIAEARWAPHPQVAVGAGLLEDPWRAAAQAAWGLPAVAAPMVERAGLSPVSDLGMGAVLSSPGGRVEGGLHLSSGEGARLRERNDGQDVAALLQVSPLGEERLSIELYGRDGSTGLGSVRDHRAGGRVAFTAAPVTAYGEVERAWGLGGDALAEPIAASAGGVVALKQGPQAWGRLDWLRARPADPESDRYEFFLGGGYAQGPALVGLSYSGQRNDPAASLIAGAEALASAHQLTLFLSAELGAPPRPSEAP